MECFEQPFGLGGQKCKLKCNHIAVVANNGGTTAIVGIEMQKRLIPISNQTEEEYQAWLKTVKPIPWLKQSDLLWIQKQRKERREAARFHAIHCTGGCGCNWRR